MINEYKKYRKYTIFLLDCISRVTGLGRINSWKFDNILLSKIDNNRFAEIVKEHKIKSDKPAIYILLDNKNERLYVGEADKWINRVSVHLSQKKWINKIIIIYSNTNTNDLTKDELKYYENRLILDFKNNLKLILDNKRDTYDKKFDLFQEIELKNEYFTIKDQLKILIPECIHDDNIINTDDNINLEFNCYISTIHKEKIQGIFNKSANTITIIANQKYLLNKCKSKSKEVEATWNGLWNKLQKFCKENLVKITKNNAVYEITILQNIHFSSPSAAGLFVKGRSTNGWTEWKNENNEPIDIYR